jgi:hypothetical protein
MPFIYTIGNLVFLIRAMFAQKNLGFQRVKQNVFWSIGWLGVIIFVLLITAELEYVPPTMFFLLMMCVCLRSPYISQTESAVS